MTKQYPCCGDSSCDLCGGSGVAEGPAADAVMKALEALPPAYDAPQDRCPRCRRGSYESAPFGAAFRVKCASCAFTWVEPADGE